MILRVLRWCIVWLSVFGFVFVAGLMAKEVFGLNATWLERLIGVSVFSCLFGGLVIVIAVVWDTINDMIADG